MGNAAKSPNTTDIVVAGAGLSGVSAAIAAARRGARVTLIEKSMVPGGTSQYLRHRFLCGLFPNTDNIPGEYLNPGLPEEISRKLSPRSVPKRMGKVWLLSYDPDRLAPALNDLLQAEKNIQVLYSTMITGCSVQQKHIRLIQCTSRGKTLSLNVRAFIDAGTGVLLHQCRAVKTQDPLKRQLSGYALEISGVHWEEALSIQVPYALYKAVERGALPMHLRWTIVSPCEKNGSVHLKMSFPAAISITVARRQSLAAIKVLKRDIPAFCSAKIIWDSGSLFPRDGNTLNGIFRLKNAHVLGGKKFSNSVMKAEWPIEFWDPKKGPVYQYPPPGGYELPPGALQAANIMNLFAAGRCVSAEPGAQASLRVGGLCIATGEAAGNIAANLLRKGHVPA
jgi:hypothetical protein